MAERITSKKRMYELLGAGAFGNTVKAFMSLDEWLGRDGRWDAPLWGVRSLVAGDPRAKLDVPTGEVAGYCRQTFRDGEFNITPMVDPMLVWRGQVFRSHDGLVCEGAAGLRHLKWREVMARHAREWSGSAATALLRHTLNDNSFDDLQTLLDTYPDHVVEFTALERCFGTVPGRNSVVWEVRCGVSGEYERSSWR